MANENSPYSSAMTEDEFLAHYATLSDREDILEHYGVPGMKWGKRKSADGGSSRPSRAEKKLDRLEERNRIVEARGARYGHREAYNRAATKLNAATASGKNVKEAMRAYEKARNTVIDNEKMARKRTHGEKVLTGVVLGVVGARVASSALRAAARR